MKILDFFPKPTPRSQQEEILLQIEADWDDFDVFVVLGPTATGKEDVGVCVAKWAAARSGKQASIIVPTNLLVEQLERNHPDIQVLHRKDAYKCAEMEMSCSAVEKSCKTRCPDCVYTSALTGAQGAPVRAANYYTYLANRMFSETLVADEAHQLVDIVQDKEGMAIWSSKHRYPHNLKTTGDVLGWIEGALARGDNRGLAKIRAALLRANHNYIIVHTTDRHYGGPEPVLKIKPVSVCDARPWLWPTTTVKKLVLMSATIGPEDIKELGLTRRRVKYIEVESPIPPVNRPVIFAPVANVVEQYRELASKHLAARITELLASEQDKGLIHIPYSWVAGVVSFLPDTSRLLFHTRDNKTEAMQKFRSSANGVLVASGMYEGVDLPYDAARWQVICKVPYLSLGDEAVAERARKDPNWYAWQAIRKVVQAAGRVCRTPDDLGVTYILDSQFSRLYQNNRGLFPNYFKQALRGIRI